MKACIITLTCEQLEELLQLPPNATLNSIDQDIRYPGIIRFRIVGIGPDVTQGGQLQEIAIELHKTTTLQLNWGDVCQHQLTNQ